MLNLDKHIIFTEWRTHINYLGLYCQALVNLVGIATNGRELAIQVATSGYISHLEEVKNVGTLSALKSSKEAMMMLSIDDYIDNMMLHRTGVKGYKGYFKLTTLKWKEGT